MAKINPIQQVLEEESYKIIEENHKEILESVDKMIDKAYSDYQILQALKTVVNSKVASKKFSFARTVIEDGIRFYLREVRGK